MIILSKIKVYHLFFLISLFIILHGIISYSNEATIDINIHDTYFVARTLDYVFLFTTIYFLDGFGYWLFLKKMNRKLVKSLTWIHSFIWISGFAAFWLNNLLEPENNYDQSNYILRLSIIATLMFIIGHPIFLINIIIGIF